MYSKGTVTAYTPGFVLADARPSAERRFTEFSGDVSGRYIGALATAARLEGIAVPRMHALVDDLIALQKPDGYFGASFHYEQPNDADMALLWVQPEYAGKNDSARVPQGKAIPAGCRNPDPL